MTSSRIPGYGRPDPSKTVTISYNGKAYPALAGDTVASALLANDVQLIGRSFKYHRPRGFVSAGCEEPNGLFVFDRGKGRVTSNVRGTTLEVFDGLTVKSQNAWPSPRFDLAAVNDVLSPLFPAGFYNKTFMWPRSFWEKLYEPAIRRLAGLGPAPKDLDPDSYTSTYGHCETLIVGGGPAGLAAALAASEAGERVILADEQGELGGCLLSMPHAEIDGLKAWAWVQDVVSKLQRKQNVTLLSRTTAIGHYHDNFVGLVERLTDHLVQPGSGMPRERLHRIRARKVIMATGAIERPVVFSGNDRPGVMLAGAARTYLNRYGVLVGRNIVISTTHNSAYSAAFDLADAGARIAAIIDTRTDIAAPLLEEAAKRNIEVFPNHAIIGTRGRLRVKGISFQSLNDTAADSKERSMDCDSLLMCGGWTPSVHLWSHAKGSLAWAEDIGAYVPDRVAENILAVGGCNASKTVCEALQQGDVAGGGSADFIVVDQRETNCDRDAGLTMGCGARGSKAFVDFQNDVTDKDIQLAVREGFKSIEHVKRYTTNGMATDQGKTSNINALGIAAHNLGQSVSDVGLTTFRPPYTPTTFAALVGHNANHTFEPVRKAPMDAWAEAQGAVFEPVALWRRARYFPQPGEDMNAAVARECLAVRNAVGMFDASTLGKIEVVGPDAAEFMNRIYTNSWSKLSSGRCRYGLMLHEDGYIYDDGVVARLAEDRFHVTTTTGGAPRVLAKMEDYLQTEWPELKLWLTSTTEQWGVIAVSGPNARALIEPFVEDIDLSPSAFPHMAIREGKICGIETRLFRVSFSGELGYEVNIPSNRMQEVWTALFERGAQLGVTAYGTETMHVLRAEKGFIIVGQETDGTVTPDDVGLSWAVNANKGDFVGKRSLDRPDLAGDRRKQLVGLEAVDPSLVLEEGAQIVLSPDQPVPMDMVGHVTSSYKSACLDRSIALALMTKGRSLYGETVYVSSKRGFVKAKVRDCVFYDPEGERLNV